MMADFTLELEALRVENARLKEKLKQHLLVEDMLLPSSSNLPRAVIGMNREGGENACPAPPWIAGLSHSLTAAQIQRYSRQLLLPSFGVKAQENLCKGSVLIVGAGGLGSPVALYLAACGVGCIGIMDPDRVELHNLHRQVIHNEASVGETKVSSASRTCLAINSSVKVVEYPFGLDARNALDIMAQYDVVVDASDNVATRYLVSDACVVANKPLVSGAALGMEGQLTVYNYLKFQFCKALKFIQLQGPCYRCLFPTPSPQAACQRCSDAGVLGVVPGIVGTFQALEVIKVLTKVGEPLSARMLILDALSSRIHTVKLRGKNTQCVACGELPQITHITLPNFDYEKFAASPMSDGTPPREQVVGEDQSITCTDYNKLVRGHKSHVLVDVREKHQYDIASLPDSLNIPYAKLPQQLDTIRAAAQKHKHEGDEDMSVYVICRRGNDSQRAVQDLRSAGFNLVYDITGGLLSWAQDVDSTFPAL
nr:adenylyltransferase and sulfurtransferase MOCS3-1-like isoform X2 [Physcomitrium patens]|eukprot:XP_024356805.1 adenylyltransferase and sulfurtransferase MOCS3-1-like isoform X2 [Physcomitrella patens]